LEREVGLGLSLAADVSFAREYQEIREARARGIHQELLIEHDRAPASRGLEVITTLGQSKAEAWEQHRTRTKRRTVVERIGWKKCRLMGRDCNTAPNASRLRLGQPSPPHGW
jgi:hypothetical protein